MTSRPPDTAVTVSCVRQWVQAANRGAVFLAGVRHVEPGRNGGDDGSPTNPPVRDPHRADMRLWRLSRACGDVELRALTCGQLNSYRITNFTTSGMSSVIQPNSHTRSGGDALPKPAVASAIDSENQIHVSGTTQEARTVTTSPRPSLRYNGT